MFTFLAIIICVISLEQKNVTAVLKGVNDREGFLFLNKNVKQKEPIKLVGEADGTAGQQQGSRQSATCRGANTSVSFNCWHSHTNTWQQAFGRFVIKLI